MSDQALRGRYLVAMAARYGAVVLPVGVSFALEAVFQPLHLRRNPLAAEDLPRTDRRALADETRHQPDDASPFPRRDDLGPVIADNGPAALAQSPTRQLVVLGGPGTGKTTLLKDLLARAIYAAGDDPAAPLPIFIALPDLARAGLDVRAYLETQARDLGVSAFAATMWENLTTGHAFLCLDSLDEVAPALRPDSITLINRMAPRWGGTWIIGSRFTEYKGASSGTSISPNGNWTRSMRPCAPSWHDASSSRWAQHMPMLFSSRRWRRIRRRKPGARIRCCCRWPLSPIPALVPCPTAAPRSMVPY